MLSKSKHKKRTVDKFTAVVVVYLESLLPWDSVIFFYEDLYSSFADISYHHNWMLLHSTFCGIRSVRVFRQNSKNNTIRILYFTLSLFCLVMVSVQLSQSSWVLCMFLWFFFVLILCICSALRIFSVRILYLCSVCEHAGILFIVIAWLHLLSSFYAVSRTSY